jgi:hypothetical protein
MSDVTCGDDHTVKVIIDTLSFRKGSTNDFEARREFGMYFGFAFV